MLQFNGPSRKGQSFPIDFSKGKDRRVSLQVEYDGSDDEPGYVIDWDEQAQRNVLKRVSTQTAAVLRWPFRAALAQEQSQPVQVDRPRSLTPPPPGTTGVPPSLCGSAIETLQDPQTDVGRKITSTETLATLDADSLMACLQVVTSREPMVVTLLDLARHSDRELASKATRVLERIDVETDVVRALTSRVAVERSRGEAILLHFDSARALRLLQNPAIATRTDLRALADAVASGRKAQVLRPTGSVKGDKYYVKARWDPDNAAVVDWLTKLFNAALMNSRTLDQEAALMRNRNQRIVYWYDKGWSVRIAEEISRCGGSAQFVSMAS